MQKIKIWKHSQGSPVTILARTHIASLTDYSASKVAKFIVRYKIVHKGQRICIPAVINSRKAKGKVLLPWVEMPKRSPRLAVKRLDRLHSRTGTSQGLSPFPSSVSLQMVCFSLSRDLVLCGVSVHVFVHVFVQAKNSNGTTVRTFSYFNLWHIPSLSFHFYVNMHSWCFLKHLRNPNVRISKWFTHDVYTWLVCW